MVKRILFGVVAFLLIFSFVASVSASEKEVKIGLRNGRMILDLDPRETVRKPLGIINTNDFPVEVELSTGGDLADDIELEEETFTLGAGEEKRTYFKITAPNKAGTTESRVLIKFIPEDLSPIGVSSQIFVKVGKDGDEEFSSIDNEEEPSFNFNPSGNAVAEEGYQGGVSMKTVLIASGCLLGVVLIVLLYFALRASKKKGSGRPSD